MIMMLFQQNMMQCVVQSSHTSWSKETLPDLLFVVFVTQRDQRDQGILPRVHKPVCTLDTTCSTQLPASASVVFV